MTMFENFYKNDDEVLFELSHVRSMDSHFLGRLFGGLSLLMTMFYMNPFFLKFLFAGLAVSVLSPLAKDFFSRQIKSLRLTQKNMEISQGLKGKTYQIEYADIRKVELIEKSREKASKRYGGKRRGEVATVLFEHGMGERRIPEDAKCVITTKRGEIIEIESRYFPHGHFEEFIKTLEGIYTRTNQPQNLYQANPSMRIAPRMRIETSEEEQKIDTLMQKNRTYLNADIELKLKFEHKLIEAYRVIYFIRTADEVAHIPDKKGIFSFKNSDGSKAYILEEDYLPNIDAENIELGNSLIQVAQKNLTIVETRIAYHRKIQDKLEYLRVQEEKRRRLKGLTSDLHNLQEANTSKNINTTFEQNEIEAEARILSELEDLTQKVHRMDDLEKSIILNEHISLFKDNNNG